MCLFDEPDGVTPIWEAEWDPAVRSALVEMFGGSLESRFSVPTVRRWNSPSGVTVAAVESRDALLAGTVLYQSWCELEHGPKYPMSPRTLESLGLPTELAPADLLSQEEVEVRIRTVRKLDFNHRIGTRMSGSGNGLRRTQNG